MAEEHNGEWRDQSEQPHDNTQPVPPVPASDDSDQPTSVSPRNDSPEADGFTWPGHGDDADSSQSPTAPLDMNETGPASDDEPTETIPDAAGRNEAPGAGSDAAPAADGQAPTQSIPSAVEPSGYRPAPEYGAYGPVPTQQQPSQQPAAAQPTQQIPPASGAGSDTNPYFTGNPFVNPDGRNANGQDPRDGNSFSNPFGMPQNPQNPQDPQNGGSPIPGGGSPQGPGMPPQSPMMGGYPNRNRSGMPVRTANNVVVAVVAALVAAALCLGVGYAALTNGWVTVPSTSSLASVNSNKSGSGSSTTKGGSTADWTTVAKSVSDSVVSIQTQLSNATAKGSGAILDSKGYIVTNNHVISGAKSIEVTLSNGQMYSAQVVGTDTTTDLAVIRLDNPPSNLKAVEFADSDNLAVGEGVMAIGNPLGYDDTATTGIVSALNRPVTVMDDNNSEIVTNAVQIDAAINPGNSGGPTFNTAGQVIGINSSIASTTTSSSSSEAGSIGIGFAIPANLVKRVANEIIKDGSVKHVMLGVTVTSTTVKADGVTRGGAQITAASGGSAVVSGSPADKAGLKAGDTIVAFNGNAVNNNYSLLGYVRAAALGDKVTLTIVRDSKTMNVDVTLNQQESAVSGSNRSDNNNSNKNNSNNNGSGSSGNSGNSDNGDDGGITDPFGLW